MSTPQPLIADTVSCTLDGKTIVDAASLTLAPGRITALLGQSGAGKSTLLRLFSGLQLPKSGRILHGETVLSDDHVLVPAEERRIGIVFQDFALFPNLTAAQNIAFGLTALAKPDQQARATDWLARISLTDRANAYPHQLSGGEQQRVAIARALAPDPVALLMDEAFSGLDPALRDEVRDLALSEVKTAGISALLVTHDASEAMVHADHLAIMREGQIIQQGRPVDLYNRPVSRPAAIALGPIITLEATPDPTGKLYQTALGDLPIDPHWPKSARQIHLRPEAVQLDPGSNTHAEIIDRRPAGPLLRLTLMRNGIAAHIQVPNGVISDDAKQLTYRLNPDLCFVF